MVLALLVDLGLQGQLINIIIRLSVLFIKSGKLLLIVSKLVGHSAWLSGVTGGLFI